MSGGGIFESFYHGPLQHPWLLWAAAGAGAAACLARAGLHPSLRRYGLALAALAALDAWLTASHVIGVGALTGAAARGVPLLFVLAGDFRYLLLAVAGTADGRLRASARDVLAALALTALVPLASQALLLALPAALRSDRMLYLVYELCFLALVAGLAQWLPSVRRAPWLCRLGRFVMLYYGLWATADALLLATGADAAYLLRVLPNVLYYGGFVAALAWLAPPDAATPARR